MSIFISYSRRDSDFVDQLYRHLERKGYDVWIDRGDIQVGSHWDESIQRAIDARSHMLVVLSPDSAESQYVTDEWSYALEEQKMVIPVRFQPCKTPMRLRRLQWIDFVDRPFATAFRDLTDALGTPENRPADPLQLARREGFVFVDTSQLRGLHLVSVADTDHIRIAFVYSDYPMFKAFASVVWYTLLWQMVDRYTYGQRWVLRDKVTKQLILPTGASLEDLLLHQVGIEPQSTLEIIMLEGDSK